MNIPSTLSTLHRKPTAMRTVGRHVLVGIFLLVAVGLSVSAAWLHSRGCGGHWDITVFMLVSSILSIMAFALLGCLIFINRPNNRIGWISYLCALGLGTTMVAAMGIQCALTTATTLSMPPLGIGYWVWVFYTFGAFVGVLPQFVLLPLLFPNGRFLSPRWAWAMWIGIALTLVTSIALGMLPDFRRHNGVTYSVDLDNPLALVGLPSWWHSVFMATSNIFLTGLCFLGMAAVVVRFRRSVGDERQQMKWLVYFLLTVVVVQLFVFELPGNLFAPEIFYTVWYDLIILAVQLGFPLTIAIAVFKYRLYNIDLIIRRTLVYGTLTGLLVALYALIVSGLGALLHVEGNFVPSLIAAGVIAVVFQPANLRLQRLLSRRLFGDRDDPAEVLTRLTDQLEAADSDESLMSNLVTTTASSLMLPYVAVWIRARSGGFELAAETGVRTEAVDVMPLMHQQEMIGQLIVAPRGPGETLAPADRHLLIAIARLVATTARTVQLTDEVQEARIRTVSAREEERRRIRRDLHDGLGPVLAGQGLKLTAARHLLRTRPEVAERLLDELIHQSEDTVAEVRRLVYGLRPPTLDELGLAEALREHVDAVVAAVPLQITLDVPEQLPEMPAAVEVAIFRIVQEALSNVIRHAQARQCTISLHMNGALDVMVVDDGTGIPPMPRRGVGLVSMQERAAEIGGICRIDNREQGGVCVWLSMPKTN